MDITDGYGPSSVGSIPAGPAIMKYISMLILGSDQKERSVFHYGNVARFGFGEEIRCALK